MTRSMIAWQAFGVIPRERRTAEGPRTEPVGEPFMAANLGEASAIGRRLVGRAFCFCRSMASIRLDAETKVPGRPA